MCFVFGYPLLPRLAHGQATQNTPTELDDAIANVKSGNFTPRDIVAISNDGVAVQAIPALEVQFKHATDIDTKISIASALVKLKDCDDTYWKFLLEQAMIPIYPYGH